MAGAGRLAKDIQHLTRHVTQVSDGQAEVTHVDENLEFIELDILPKDGYYRGAKIHFRITFNKIQYPAVCPSVTCMDMIYHPNIYPSSGDPDNVCVSLMDEWVPTMDLDFIVIAILFIFQYPNCDDPLSPFFDILDSMENMEDNIRRTLRGEEFEDVNWPCLLVCGEGHDKNDGVCDKDENNGVCENKVENNGVCENKDENNDVCENKDENNDVCENKDENNVCENKDEDDGVCENKEDTSHLENFQYKRYSILDHDAGSNKDFDDCLATNFPLVENCDITENSPAENEERQQASDNGVLKVMETNLNVKNSLLNISGPGPISKLSTAIINTNNSAFESDS